MEPITKIECDECGSRINGTCLAKIENGIAILYFCNSVCKKDYIRINGW